MPMGVTKKQERQYEHIKESYQERGVSTDEAKERAARTVNKHKGAEVPVEEGLLSAISLQMRGSGPPAAASHCRRGR